MRITEVTGALVFGLSFCLLSATPSQSGSETSPQTIEYGSPAELKGVTKIYVYTGTELEVRNNIIKNIKKKLKDLVVTDSLEEAEVYLLFAADTQTFFAGMQHRSSSTTTGQAQSSGNTTYGTATSSTTSSSTPQYRTVVTGKAMVVKPGKQGAVRLLMDFGDSRATILERRPSTNFARAFVKAYQEANQ